MHRLHTRRAGHGEFEALEGFPRVALEGDALGEPADEGPALRPFAHCIPDAIPMAAPLASGGGVDDLLSRARELEVQGRRLDAINLLTETVARAADDPRPAVRLATLLEAGGDTEEALEVLGGALVATEGHVDVRVARGALFSRLKRYAEAEVDLRAAIAADPAGGVAHRELGLALLRRGLPGDALSALERATALDPGDAAAALHLGEAHYLAADLPRAELALRRAGDLAPDDPRPWTLLGRLLDRLGRTDEARVMHRRARDAGTV